MSEWSNLGTRLPVWVTYHSAPSGKRTLTVHVRRLFIVGIRLPGVAFVKGVGR